MSGDRIEEMYAFVVLDDMDGNEGIPAYAGPIGPMPMVGADLARVESLRPIAEQIARDYGKPVEVRVWRGPYEVIEVIG